VPNRSPTRKRMTSGDLLPRYAQGGPSVND
jgi:hypothetical protein